MIIKYEDVLDMYIYAFARHFYAKQNCIQVIHIYNKICNNEIVYILN